MNHVLLVLVHRKLCSFRRRLEVPLYLSYHSALPLLSVLRPPPLRSLSLPSRNNSCVSLFGTEVDGVFVEMDSFADAVISYYHGRLANGWDPGQPAANGARQSGGAGGGVEGERGIRGARSTAEEDKPSVPGRGRSGLRGDVKGRGSDDGRGKARPERGGAERPAVEKLCSVVVEQWRRSAAALTRSRCVKGGKKRERRSSVRWAEQAVKMQ